MRGKWLVVVLVVVVVFGGWVVWWWYGSLSTRKVTGGRGDLSQQVSKGVVVVHSLVVELPGLKGEIDQRLMEKMQAELARNGLVYGSGTDQKTGAKLTWKLANQMEECKYWRLGKDRQREAGFGLGWQGDGGVVTICMTEGVTRDINKAMDVTNWAVGLALSRFGDPSTGIRSSLTEEAEQMYEKQREAKELPIRLEFK